MKFFYALKIFIFSIISDFIWFFVALASSQSLIGDFNAFTSFLISLVWPVFYLLMLFASHIQGDDSDNIFKFWRIVWKIGAIGMLLFGIIVYILSCFSCETAPVAFGFTAAMLPLSCLLCLYKFRAIANKNNTGSFMQMVLIPILLSLPVFAVSVILALIFRNMLFIHVIVTFAFVIFCVLFMIIDTARNGSWNERREQVKEELLRNKKENTITQKPTAPKPREPGGSFNSSSPLAKSMSFWKNHKDDNGCGIWCKNHQLGILYLNSTSVSAYSPDICIRFNAIVKFFHLSEDVLKDISSEDIDNAIEKAIEDRCENTCSLAQNITLKGVQERYTGYDNCSITGEVVSVEYKNF